MNQKFLISVFILFNFKLFSQKLEMKLTYPTPRVGDVIDFTIKLKNDTNKILKGGSGFFNYLKIEEQKYKITGNIQLLGYTKDTGIIEIGPINIKINDTTYLTEVLKFKVIEKLPNKKRGLWAHTANSNGNEYLIIEQRLPYDIKTGIPFGEFAKFKENSVLVPGIKFINLQTNTILQIIIDEDDGQETYVNTKSSVYKINKDNKFKGNFKLSKDYFENVWFEIKFKEIEIN